MEYLKNPGKGVITDVKGRLRCYKNDWLHAFHSGPGIIAPMAFMFFASAIPVIAFGEQLSKATDGALTPAETLMSTALCGVIHAIFGGQPLLILGVAEPTIIMYSYLYSFIQTRIGKELFLAWAGWVCTWTALFLLLIATFNLCAIIHRFTRLAGELFGMLIAVLFIQEAIKGIIEEFNVPEDEEGSTEEKYHFQWLYINGLLAVIFATGVLLTTLKSRNARSWVYGTGWFRSFIAEYGVPVAVIIWTALSFAIPSKIPSGIPRRLDASFPWKSNSHWDTIVGMGRVPGGYIFAAIIPALMVAGLYFFDHSIAARMAQQKDFNLKKPSAFHYDVFLLGIMTFICGILGLPPSNGVLPQSPMHTRSLAILKRQMVRRKMVQRAKDGIEEKVSHSEIYGRMHDVLIEMEASSPPKTVKQDLTNLRESVVKHDDKGNKKEEFDPEKCVDLHLPVLVNEQRLSNLGQSILVGVAACAMPVIRLIPTSVLWGYFAYMAIDSLPGNQFWERLLFLFVTKQRRYKIIEELHASYIESVPFKYIFMLTVFQIMYLMVCFGITWIPIAGILFPFPFFLLIFIRERLLPKVIPTQHLQDLDSPEYEEVYGHSYMPNDQHRKKGESEGDENEVEMSPEEILDLMTTHRGEFKHRSLSYHHPSRKHHQPQGLQASSSATQ
ncbi:probable boron transporter 7 [Andrographis paniculata]|uniref:probable boron transporter 7 n=1 Tax=Andrographis paniculata TaxID=175694 RepID=UPI0021E9A74C|nr:probable boron transporter 7 [Andrographis paniculata]